MNHFSRFFFGISFILSLFVSFPAQISMAHVSADAMPDSMAEVEYNILLEFKPNDTVLHNKLGMVYYRLKKFPKAVKEFSKVLKLDKHNYNALDGMGLVKAAQQKYNEAISHYQKAIAVNTEDMAGYYHLAGALEKKSRFKDAAKAYHRALIQLRKQYPSGTENKKADTIKEKIKAAIQAIETGRSQ